MIDFNDWCYHAVAEIRFKPDREAVFLELKNHLEDHYEDLISQGNSPEKAQRLAMEAMGDPEEIAPQLGQIHKPWLGYIYRTVKWITIPLFLWALFLLIAFTGSHIHSVISTANYDSLREEAEGGYYCKPNVSAHSDGYTFKVTEAAINSRGDTLYFELQSTYWPWLQQPAIAHDIWAVDSLGNHYACKREFKYDDVPKVAYQGGFFSQGICVLNMKITHFDSSAQWIELHYDRDGRNIVLRIDLTGGEAE